MLCKLFHFGFEIDCRFQNLKLCAKRNWPWGLKQRLQTNKEREDNFKIAHGTNFIFRVYLLIRQAIKSLPPCAKIKRWKWNKKLIYLRLQLQLYFVFASKCFCAKNLVLPCTKFTQKRYTFHCLVLINIWQTRASGCFLLLQL